MAENIIQKEGTPPKGTPPEGTPPEGSPPKETKPPETPPEGSPPENEEKGEKRFQDLVGKLKDRTIEVEDLKQQLANKEIDAIDDNTPITKKDLEKYNERIYHKNQKELSFKNTIDNFKKERSIGEDGWDKIGGEYIEKSAKALVKVGLIKDVNVAMSLLYSHVRRDSDEVDHEKEKFIQKLGGGSSRGSSLSSASKEVQEIMNTKGWDKERATKAIEIRNNHFS